MAEMIEKPREVRMTVAATLQDAMHGGPIRKLAEAIEAKGRAKRASFFDAFDDFGMLKGRTASGGWVLLETIREGVIINEPMLRVGLAHELGVEVKEIFPLNENAFGDHTAEYERVNPAEFLPVRGLPTAGYGIHGEGHEHFTNTRGVRLTAQAVGSLNAQDKTRTFAIQNGADGSKISKLEDHTPQLEKATYTYPATPVVGHVALPKTSGGTAAAVARNAALAQAQKLNKKNPKKKPPKKGGTP